MELNKLKNVNCLEGMKHLPDNSIDAIVTDPPYKYLKHKLDRDFDEESVFDEFVRVLKPEGFVVIFGRGIPFHRWNLLLSCRGLKFKEEIIWDKRSTTSPFLALNRKHETVSLLTKKGKIRESRIPYNISKKNDLASVAQDLKRVSSALKNPTSLAKIEKYLFSGEEELDDYPFKTKYGHTASGYKGKDRGLVTAKSIVEGMRESSIITIGRDSRKETIHPTQKPIQLMERLIKLVTDESQTVLDPFAGSASTLLACQNLNRKYIGFEIDSEYYESAKKRLYENKKRQLDLLEWL